MPVSASCGHNDRMTRETLLDFFDDRIRSASQFLIYDDGYRTRTYTYIDLRRAAVRFTERLRREGIAPHDTVVVWGENRPEWIAALWGALLARAVVVPIDSRASTELLERVTRIVHARVVMVGSEVPQPTVPSETQLWHLEELMSETPPHDGYGDVIPAVTLDASGGTHSSNDLAEIIFTSGATAEPKGVQITHRNILANIVPVEREILKYRNYGRPFFPLRFLNLLPLSHMFGQAMATFVPPMLEGITVFMSSLNPTDIVRQIRTRRVSVLVCVPKILEMLRDHLIHIAPEVAKTPHVKPHVTIRWWRHREIHRLFGYKFWAFVVGAAPLDPELEDFWSRLGFLVIQGYGLTEAAPIVTLNHPFHARRGSVGTPIGGVEVSIAPDGEILVRGDNVTRGYYNAPEETKRIFDNGWFHTGDIGVMDESGRLTVRGRKKEMIVTPDGLNIFPEDVERVINDTAGVRDAAVVGVTRNGQEHVHAILVLDRGSDADTIVRQTNERLENHQRIRSCSIWSEESLPRTEGTQKLKRRELKSWVEGKNPEAPRGLDSSSTVDAVVARFVHGQTITETTTLAELGLSSIERIELMMALERQFDRTVDEITFQEAATVSDLRALVTKSDTIAASATVEDAFTARHAALTFPTWSQSAPARIARRLALATFLLPLTRLFAWIRVKGLDRLAPVKEPVVYAANHQSYIDAAVILAAMPARRRYRIATAAAKEFFAAHYRPDQHSRLARLTSSLSYYLSTLFFNVFPLPQREAGTRESIRYLGELLSAGTSVLIFPEGVRTETGEIDEFRPGIGMIALRLKAPIIPVRIVGVDRILHRSWRMARPGSVRVIFGAPLQPIGTDYRTIAKQVEEAVKAL